jgi:hypothetical protein
MKISEVINQPLFVLPEVILRADIDLTIIR